MENNAPSKPGIKHLDDADFAVLVALLKQTIAADR
jgi:hypothetical protein